MDIKAALESLDHAVEDLWTNDGLPRVDAVSAIVGREVTRGEITAADPEFTRGAVAGPSEEKDPEPEPTPDTAPVVKAEPKKAHPKMTDAESAAFVEIADDVVGMSPAAVFADLDLLQRASAEFSRQADILSKRREAVNNKINDIGRRSARIDSAISKLNRGVKGPTAITEYLARQRESAALKVAKAQRFIDAGTTQEAVMEQMQISSKLDRAMKNRPKSVRPAAPSLGTM